jgi:hypothetical protein
MPNSALALRDEDDDSSQRKEHMTGYNETDEQTTMVAPPPNLWMKATYTSQPIPDSEGQYRHITTYRPCIAFERVWSDDFRQFELKPWQLLGSVGERFEWDDDIEDATVVHLDVTPPARIIEIFDAEHQLVSRTYPTRRGFSDSEELEWVGELPGDEEKRFDVG